MKKNGFTLVEILAAVAIIAILLIVAVPNITSIGNKSKVQMFCTKVKNLESAAQQYGEDNYDKIGNDVTISIYDVLITGGYYKKEEDNCTRNSTTNPCVSDPRDKTPMENGTIRLVKKNRRITATYNYKNNNDKNSCANS